MRRFFVIILLGSALVLLAGCGGRTADAPSNSGGGSETPAEQPTKKALPTMPSARFAAPTSMITPQGSGAEAEVEVTATMTPTEEIDATEEITATEEMTATEEVTATEELTATEEITDTEVMTDTE